MKPVSASFRVVLLLVTAGGLLGCSLSQLIAPSGQPPAANSPAPAISPAAGSQEATPLPPSPTASLSVPPTETPLPTVTPLPTYTRAPTLTPFPTSAPLPTIVLPTMRPALTPTFNPKGTDYPYTLRVFNRGKREYWIGTHPPTLGHCIDPDEYIEFYLTQTQAIRVYWCEIHCGAKNPERVMQCQNRLVSVTETLTKAEVP